MKKKEKKIPKKMRFSIQEERKEKQIFFTFKEAIEKTGISSGTLFRFLKGENFNEDRKFTRRSDKKVFFIQVEDDDPFIQTDGENIFSVEEIAETFNISRTVFLNQILRKKNHFLDSQEISHKITWKSPEFEFFIDKLRGCQIIEKIIQKAKGEKRVTRNSTSIFHNHKDLVDIIEKV